MKRRDFIKTSVIGGAAVAVPKSSGAADGKFPHRYIDNEACIGCGKCYDLCPMGAIAFDGSDRSEVDPHECAECGVCWRSKVCPEDAIRQGKLEWPRTLREVFSNPLAEHEGTGVPGRGTEGIKTNDSHERYKRGEMGVFIELGRPALGARFYDAEKVVKKFRAHNYFVIAENPVSSLIENPETGELKKEVLQEKCLSILIEFILPADNGEELLEMIRELSGEVDTVFNVCVALRSDENNRSPFPRVFPYGTFSLPNGKVNIGLAEGVLS
jgi:ferredoxin